MQKRKNFSTIESILQSLIQGRRWGPKIEQYRLLESWAEIVGPAIAKQTTPHLWHGETLTVKVANFSWMQELKMMEPEIIGKLKVHTPELKIKKIRWEI